MRYLKTYIKFNEQNSTKTDYKVGKEFWFEYHCDETEDSCDRNLFLKSHQKAKVISISDEGCSDSEEERIENSEPRIYKVEFSDGSLYDVFEDELVDSPEEFYRPDPPKE